MLEEYGRKGLTIELKDSDTPGLVMAQFAAFNEIDRDGEITKPKAFGSQDVLLGAYGHTSFGRMGAPQPPVGRGKISEKSGHAIFEGQFNLDMVAGREMYESVKMAGDLQEWSYGYRVLKESQAMVEGRPVRVLETLSVKEVSPVMVGAGNDTQTLAIKSDTGDMTLEEHSDVALVAWSDFLERLKALADLRAKDGRALSVTNRLRLEKMASHLHEMGAEISQLLESAEPRDKAAAEAVKAAYLKTMSRINGVAVGA